MEIDYSVIIRTTGKAGEKYERLLESIDHLEPRPKEVIVVLPEGYDLPAERLGWETFYFCPKGMVIQRMTGIEKCKTRYALICDDDVKFDPDFVEKLYRPVREGNYRLSAGPLYSFLPSKGANALLCTVMSSAMPTLFHKKDRYVSVLKSSGYSYNRHLQPGRIYETQSVAWTCFFAEVAAIREINFGAESWLDSHGYSALDDQTMFYKAWLRGIKTAVVADAVYEHMDARTSRRGNRPDVTYSMGFNRVVFWHRFIYSMQTTGLQKTQARIAFAYFKAWIGLRAGLKMAAGRMKKEYSDLRKQAYQDAERFLRSAEYAALPPVHGETAQDHTDG